MADNVSKNVSIKTSVDTSDIVNKIAQLGTVGESSADKLKPLFTGLSADAAAAALKIDELVEAYDRFVNKAAGAASRGTGARYADDLQTTSYQLEDLRRQYSNTSTFSADSQQAKEYAANLAVVERALANIDAIQSRINAQATVSATFKHQGRHLFDTLNAEQQARATGNVSKFLAERPDNLLERVNAAKDVDDANKEFARQRFIETQHRIDAHTDEQLARGNLSRKPKADLSPSARQSIYGPPHVDDPWDMMGPPEPPDWINKRRENVDAALHANRMSSMERKGFTSWEQLEADADEFQKKQEKHQDRLGRRAFIGQQLAFGADDAFQQFMWSNSTASGIGAAARAAGNNLTAALSATGMTAGPMAAAMLGVQGLGMGVSAYSQSLDESNKLRLSTKPLEGFLSRQTREASNGLEFRRSLRTGSADSLAEAETQEQEESEVRQGRLKDIRRRQAEADEVRNRGRRKGRDWMTKPLESAWGAIWGLHGYGDSDEVLQAEADEGVLRGEANTLAAEEAEFKKRSAARTEVMKRRHAYETRGRERTKRDTRRVSGFFGNLQDNESLTGVIMSGEEMADAYYDELGYGVDTGVEGDMEMRKQDQDRRRNFAIRSQQKSAAKTNRAMDSRWQYRDDPNARFKVEYEDTAESIDEDFAMLSQEERDGMKEKAMRQRDFNIFQNNKAMATNLYRSYQTLEGDDLNAGSVGDARLRAKLSMPDPAQEENSKKFDDMAASLKSIERDIARMAGNQNQVVQMV